MKSLDVPGIDFGPVSEAAVAEWGRAVHVTDVCGRQTETTGKCTPVFLFFSQFLLHSYRSRSARDLIS